jgi:hypothetical protein
MKKYYITLYINIYDIDNSKKYVHLFMFDHAHLIYV